MDEELIKKFMDDIRQDYETMGQNKEIQEWLIEAIKRHIIGVDDLKANYIAQEILKGIEIYRDYSIRHNDEETLEGVKHKLSPEDIKLIDEETKIIAEITTQDIQKSLKEENNYG